MLSIILKKELPTLWFIFIPIYHVYADPGCSNPGIPYGGRKTGSRYGANDQVGFTCNEGYTLIGSSERTCLCDEGDTCEWDGEQPICRGELMDNISRRYDNVFVSACYHGVPIPGSNN